MMSALTSKKIALISREWPVNMLSGLEDGLLADLRDYGVGRISSVRLAIDLERGRMLVDILGEICEGDISLRVFTGMEMQRSINEWLEEEGIEEFKSELVRADGRIFALFVGRRK